MRRRRFVSRTRCSALRAAPQSRDQTVCPWTPDQQRTASRCAAPGERIERERTSMNFDDTPQEAAFRAEAKAWIAANAPKQYEEELRKSSLGRSGLKGPNILEVA